MLDYEMQIQSHSRYNTPPVFPIYMAMLNLQWLKQMGGVENMFNENKEKARLLYEEIDRNSLFTTPVQRESASMMNVIFDLKDDTLSEDFIRHCHELGIVQIKGHRLRGGFRASIYNAMPKEGIEHLIHSMQTFEEKHQN